MGKDKFLCFLQNEKFQDIVLVLLLFSGITNGEPLPSKYLSLQEKHLVRCLTYISHRHFAPGRSLVISSPTTYRDVQQDLIAEIQRTSIWPVVVTVDGNINKPDKSDFIHTEGTYIILLPDGDIRSLMVQIAGLIRGRDDEFTRLWNPEARFVVAGANIFSISQQKDIFDYFSKFRIYNCIIVNQENYILDKEFSREKKVDDVDTGMKLGVYTWFPYQSSDRCTEVNDITLLDRWVISAQGHFTKNTSAQGHFTKNTDLFPRKFTNRFNGCPMKTVVRNSHWYFTTNYVYYQYSNGDDVGHIEGLESDLLMLVLQQMNMTFVYVPTPNDFEIENSVVTNLIWFMFEKVAYLALGNIGTHYLSVSIFDSTSSYYMMGARWYVPCSVKNQRWSSIFRIFSLELWFVLIISIVIAAISTTLFGRYSCTSEWQRYKSVTSSLTNIWAVIVCVPVSTLPRAPSLRSLFLAWMCFSLAFSTVFQALLTIFLIDSGYITPIQNMDELYDSGMKLAYQPGHNFMIENGDETEFSKVQRNRVNCPSFEVCLDWAKYQKNVSVLLLDKVAEDEYARGDFVGENSEPLLCRLEDGIIYTFGQSMIMFHGDPLMRRVNEIIDRVVEAGLYNHWVSLNKHVLKLYSGKIAIVHPLDGYYSFNLYHMQVAFYLLLMGWCLCVLCFVFEVLYNHIFTKIL
jgi:hypothetical protein